MNHTRKYHKHIYGCTMIQHPLKLQVWYTILDRILYWHHTGQMSEIDRAKEMVIEFRRLYQMPHLPESYNLTLQYCNNRGTVS